MPLFRFEGAQTGIFVGELKADTVDELAKEADWAWRGNMDTFDTGVNWDDVCRVTEINTNNEKDCVVGWFSNAFGRFVKR